MKKKDILHSKDKHSRIRLKINVGMFVKADKSKSFYIQCDFSWFYTCCPRRAK